MDSRVLTQSTTARGIFSTTLLGLRTLNSARSLDWSVGFLWIGLLLALVVFLVYVTIDCWQEGHVIPAVITGLFAVEGILKFIRDLRRLFVAS